MPTCDMNKFQGVFQICANCCIPASIENVIRYYGHEFSQRKFLDIFLKDNNMPDLNFEKVKEVLDSENEFNKYFDFEHETIKDHENIGGLLDYIRDCIGKDLPVIVALKQELENEINRHIVTVHYIDDKKISYFDSNPKSGGFVNFIPISEFVKLLPDGLGTLLIKNK